jgi:two-component system cell cycle sensor histidine kinase/response regulator CckA
LPEAWRTIFNNLLTIITGYSHFLREKISSSENECLECLSEILAAAQVGRSITHQLLAYGGRQISTPVTLDLGLVIENLASILQQAAGESTVLITKLDSTATLVNADEGQLEQVLLNLVLNSKDAMPHGGTLTISTSVEGSGVVLRVTDTGVGMDRLTSERIFEPFFTTKVCGQGTGLGLATVYGVVTQHHGSLQVESTPGNGTTMTITFPQAQRVVEILQPGIALTSSLWQSGAPSLFLQPQFCTSRSQVLLKTRQARLMWILTYRDRRPVAPRCQPASNGS